MNMHAKVVSIAAAVGGNSLVDTANGCRASNLGALQCTPELYTLFPTTSATDLASAVVQVWSCELSSATLTSALVACVKSDGTRAYTDAEVQTAVAATISLTFLDVAHIPVSYGGGINNELAMIGLSQGDLTHITPSEAARFLIISALPGDYSPLANSLIAAVDSAFGIQVATLAQNPAADYRSTNHCWISQPLSTYTSNAVPYQQILCFESTGANAVANIPGIFASIRQYIPSPPPVPDTGPTIVSALVSTGGAGADKSAVLTALFNGCRSLIRDGAGYNLTCFRIDVFTPSWAQPLTALFDQLKSSQS